MFFDIDTLKLRCKTWQQVDPFFQSAEVTQNSTTPDLTRNNTQHTRRIRKRTLGSDTALAGRVRRLDPRLALLPVMTAVGTLAGAALSTLLLPPLTAGDTMAVGAGFGYYSLSSIFIADFRGAELGTVALLCNVMRELFTLLAAPLVARWFGPLAAVSIGGATTFDTTLPIITQSAGKPYAVVSIFHGCVLDFSVPFLVTFFCTM